MVVTFITAPNTVISSSHYLDVKNYYIKFRVSSY